MAEDDAPDLCADLRNVSEGDDVTLTTTEDEFMAKVTKMTTNHATDPDVIRETTNIWFDQEGAECVVQVIDGLAQFEWEDEYPQHMPLYDETNDVGLGYITGVEIHGELEA